MATVETQKEFVARMLRERGGTGVGAHELTYGHGITRAAAIIHELRREGWNIETQQEQGQQAVYILKSKLAVQSRALAADTNASARSEAGQTKPPTLASEPEPPPAYDFEPIGWTELGEKWRAERFVGRDGDSQEEASR